MAAQRRRLSLRHVKMNSSQVANELPLINGRGKANAARHLLRVEMPESTDSGTTKASMSCQYML